MTDITVATFQARAIYGNIYKSLKIIRKSLRTAEQKNVDLICFPECFLQGYILDEKKARELSIELQSSEFHDILNTFKSKTTVILGLIEKERDEIFNTAVVFEKGLLRGKYRKQNLLKKESFFSCGTESPIFNKNGINFGINICSDTRVSDYSDKLSQKGAQILFVPLNNSLPHGTAEKWKNKHLDYWVKRARETSCWVITSDVIEKSEENTGYGFTTIIDPGGNVIQRAKQFEEGLLVQNIILE